MCRFVVRIWWMEIMNYPEVFLGSKNKVFKVSWMWLQNLFLGKTPWSPRWCLHIQFQPLVPVQLQNPAYPVFTMHGKSQFVAFIFWLELFYLPPYSSKLLHQVQSLCYECISSKDILHWWYLWGIKQGTVYKSLLEEKSSPQHLLYLKQIRQVCLTAE